MLSKMPHPAPYEVSYTKSPSGVRNRSFSAFGTPESLLVYKTGFFNRKIPEIVASSLVRGSEAASPQSRGSVAKILLDFLISKSMSDLPRCYN